MPGSALQRVLARRLLLVLLKSRLCLVHLRAEGTSAFSYTRDEDTNSLEVIGYKQRGLQW